jgi:hypothetical protein
VVHNPSFSNWHFDSGDFDLDALLYFGEFTGGEIQLGPSFCKTILLGNLDLVFINSSEIYYRSLPFQGKRVNIIFYNNIIKQKDLKLNVPQDLQQ